LEEIQVETNEFAFHHRFHHSINDLRRLQYKIYEGKILDAYLLVRHVGLHPEREREGALWYPDAPSAIMGYHTPILQR
jgi:hypothetical protein